MQFFDCLTFLYFYLSVKETHQCQFRCICDRIILSLENLQRVVTSLFSILIVAYIDFVKLVGESPNNEETVSEIFVHSSSMKIYLVVNDFRNVVSELEYVFFKYLSHLCKMLNVNESENAAYFSPLFRRVNFVFHQIVYYQL